MDDNVSIRNCTFTNITFENCASGMEIRGAVEDSVLDGITGINTPRLMTVRAPIRNTTIRRVYHHPVMRKIGRNDPCWCGSGKKYKKCCSP